MTRTVLRLFPLPVVAATLLVACGSEPPPLPPVDVTIHRDSIEQWHAFRKNAVYGPSGWATLLGLWWMKPGETSIGSDLKNTIALPRDRSPKYLGSIWINGDSARLVVGKGVQVTVDTMQTLVTDVSLHSDLEPKATIVRAGPLTLHYIVREDRGTLIYGIRIKDTLSAARTTSPALRYFPTDISLRVQAEFIKSPKPDSLNIISVLGMETRMEHPGDVRFTLKGKPYSLMVIREPEDHGQNLFVMFTDSTNRKETYPATRYVWVTPADSLGRTIIDFNKAFNPPCAFTNFATCPFPPKGNHLPLRVEGGEWNPHYGEPHDSTGKATKK